MKRIVGVFWLLLLMAVPAFATVSVETTRVAYTCNGVLTSYAYPFKVLSDADLLVVKKATATSAETTLTLNTDYTVTGAGTSGGNVVLTAGSKCGSGYTLTILRDMAATQTTDYVDGEAFSAVSIEDALDKVTMIQQQQREQIGRAPKLPETSTITDISLPNPAANNYLGWNAGATGLENKPSPVITTATQYEVDALVSYGSGTSYTQATIEAALTAIGTTNKVTLLLRPGGWAISTPLAIPANVTLNMPAGAYFTFSGTGAVTFGFGSIEEAKLDWFYSGTGDATEALQQALGSGAPAIRLSNKTYVMSTSTTNTLGAVNIKIVGDDGATIDGTTSTDATLITIQGSMSTSAALGTSAVAKTRTVITSLASSLVAGDIIQLTSTDKWNSYAAADYLKGEFAEVESISGTTITTRTPLYDSYTNTTTTVTKYIMPKVAIENIRILRNSNDRALYINAARDVRVSRMYISGSRERALYLNNIFHSILEGNTIRDCWYSGTGTSYGIMVAQSYGTVVRDNNIYGGRHAFTTGGTYPVYNVRVLSNTFSSYSTSTSGSLDFHLATEDVVIEGNTCFGGGITWGGKNLKIGKNTVYSMEGASTSAAIKLYLYADCDYILIDGVTIKGLGTGSAGIQILMASPNITLKKLTITNSDIESVSHGILVTPNTLSDTDTTITQFMLKGNSITTTGAAAYGLYIVNTVAATISVGQMVVSDEYYVATFKPLYVLVTSTGILTVANSSFYSGGSGEFGLTFSGFAYAKMTDSYIKATAVAGGAVNRWLLQTRVDISRTIFEAWKTNGGIYSSATTVYLQDNTYTDCTGDFTGGAAFKITPAEVIAFASIDAKTNVINTVGKYQGKMIFDITNDMPLWATGATDVSTWVDGAGVVKSTPH